MLFMGMTSACVCVIRSLCSLFNVWISVNILANSENILPTEDSRHFVLVFLKWRQFHPLSCMKCSAFSFKVSAEVGKLLKLLNNPELVDALPWTLGEVLVSFTRLTSRWGRLFQSLKRNKPKYDHLTRGLLNSTGFWDQLNEHRKRLTRLKIQ